MIASNKQSQENKNWTQSGEQNLIEPMSTPRASSLS